MHAVVWNPEADAITYTAWCSTSAMLGQGKKSASEKRGRFSAAPRRPQAPQGKYVRNVTEARR